MFYWIGHTAAKIFGKLFLSYRVVNRERLRDLPDGLIVAANHVSFLDPPLIGAAFREPIYYFARKTLFDHPIADFILTRVRALPVNQEKPELSILKRVIALLRDGEKVLIFPEGERSWDGTMNAQGQPGVGMIGCKAGVPVLPVRIFGAEKALPRGGKRIRRHPVTLVVGEPFSLEEIAGDDSLGTKEKYQAVADRIMKAIAELELSDGE